MEITKLIQISSLEIAQITGKNHFDVLRDIRKILIELEITESKFAGSYTEEDIAMLTRLQSINTGLIHAGWDFDKRKAYLTRYFESKKNLRLVQPEQKQLEKGA